MFLSLTVRRVDRCAILSASTATHYWKPAKTVPKALEMIKSR
jgi:hypothetical protein